MHFYNNLPSVPPFDQSSLTKVVDQKTLQDKGNERQCLLVESIISLKATSSHEGKGAADLISLKSRKNNNMKFR